MSGPDAVAIVAAHDEEEAIARTVKRLAAMPGVREVVVVADGCRDRTVGEAAGAGARVLATSVRRGKGSAVEGALDRVEPAAVYVLVDGDVGDTAGEAAALLASIRSGRVDIAIGMLPPLEGGGFGVVRRLSGWLIQGVTGLRAQAPLSGQRALTREALFACRPLANGFGLETAMTIDAARLGLRIEEVPVEMGHRPTGRSLRGFAHRGRQGVDVLRAVAPRALRFR